MYYNMCAPLVPVAHLVHPQPARDTSPGKFTQRRSRVSFNWTPNRANSEIGKEQLVKPAESLDRSVIGGGDESSALYVQPTVTGHDLGVFNRSLMSLICACQTHLMSNFTKGAAM